ncbi:MAG: hypothetical protein K0S08_242 [Gammaproteobacteria bacterium]|jgi:type II secretory pathway pseudopilin PulG|nr:hypothetical protein [Gammaproteobacteria bacterium]
MSCRTSIKAFSLLELLLVLSIGALIIATSVRFYSTSIRDSRVTQAAQDIKVIRQAAAEWVLNQPDYKGGSTNCTTAPNNCISMTALNSAGLLPKSISDGTGTTPWQTNYSIAPNSTNATQIDITLSSITSVKNCINLKNLLSKQAISIKPSDCTMVDLTTPFQFTVTFG